jgi:hypothetical protein
VCAAGEESVSRLIYIADITRPAGFPGEDLSWMDTAPHVRVHPDSRDSARTTRDSPAWAGVQAYN